MDIKRLSLIQTVLSRIPLSPGQITLFKALYEAGDKWISKAELAYRIREGDEEALVGVLGALGNRINQTDGVVSPYDGIGLMFEIPEYHDEWHYRMLPELRIAIDDCPPLLQAIKWSMNTIFEVYPDGLQL